MMMMTWPPLQTELIERLEETLVMGAFGPLIAGTWMMPAFYR